MTDCSPDRPFDGNEAFVIETTAISGELDRLRYPAGSWGPTVADEFIAREGAKWREP
jgi:glucose-6-phosphate 1-dehydrogenase